MPDLSVKQEEALRLLLDGSNQADAARAVGVDRSTVSRWCREHDAFRERLRQGRAELVRHGIRRFAAAIDRAVEAVVDVVKDEKAKPADRLRAAEILLSRVGWEGAPVDEAERLPNREEAARRVAEIYGFDRVDDDPELVEAESRPPARVRVLRPPED